MVCLCKHLMSEEGQREMWKGLQKLLLNFGIQHFVCPEMFEGHMNCELRILRLRCMGICTYIKARAQNRKLCGLGTGMRCLGMRQLVYPAYDGVYGTLH